jgi:poly-gamma-glutamate synthesis protein (capsule biosynthesis protein)
MKDGVLYKLALGILTVLMIAQVFWLFLLFSGKNILKNSSQSNTVHKSYSSSQEFYGGEIKNQDRSSINKKSATNENHIYGGIVPHHLLVKDFIDSFFSKLKEQQYKTVIIISPNHFSVGNNNISFSEVDWETPFGKLVVDDMLIAKAKQYGLMSEEEPFAREHGISGLTPFVKKYFPEAKFIPFIIKNNTTKEEITKLADFLIKNVDVENTLVLASVDFSHYQPTIAADFHDLKSINAIQSFSKEEIMKAEVDSPLSLLTLSNYLENIGAKDSSLIYSTNSGRLINKEDEPTTSHSFLYFKKGESFIATNVNFLFFGDMMLDRNVGDKLKGKKVDYLLTELAGEENRFFSGVDIISANLEGAVTNNGAHYNPINSYDFAFSSERIEELKKYGFNYFTLANNHFSDQGQKGVEETRKNLSNLGFNYSGATDAQIDEYSRKDILISDRKIALVGFSMVYRDFDLEKARQMVKDASTENDLVIVNIHWGVEYQHQFNKHQQDVGHALIDSGASAIIGHHPHVVQGMEIYQGRPIFYSLGNFIFDQYFSADTQESLAVGLDFSKATTTMFLFPLKSEKSVPRLMNVQEKEIFLNKFISWSEVGEDIKAQIKNQKINILQLAD